MNEFEDAILPDDYQEAPPQAEESFETPVSEEVDTLETEQTEEQAEEARQEAIQALKVKYNKEEMEIPLDDAIPLVQKGLNYDKTLERLQALESDPRLSFVEELAQEQNMSVPEYLEAVQQMREQQRLDELLQQNIPEEYAREMLESRRFREQLEAEKKAKAAEEQKNAEFQEFFDSYRQFNGKDFVPGTDEIPQEVWEAHASGTPLKYAFMEHQMKELQSQVKVLQQNKQNEQKAPVGSVSAHGSQSVESEDEFLRGFNSI